MVTEQNKGQMILNEEKVSLPDFVLARTGTDSTYFTFAILRQLEKLGVYCCNPLHAIELDSNQSITGSCRPTYS